MSQFFGCTPLGPVGWTIGAGSALGATFANGALTKLMEHVPQADRTGTAPAVPKAEHRTNPHAQGSPGYRSRRRWAGWRSNHR